MKLSDFASMPKDEDGPVFAEPWEAQAFALAVKLNEAGVFSWSDWAATLSAEVHAQPERGYYESWLAALERLVEDRGLITALERHDRIDAWDEAARSTPHGHPIELSRSSPARETVR